MAQTTITEALAEIKTIGKRVEAKRAFITQYVARHAIVRDPLANQGGSPAAITAELQSIQDLEERAVNIRLAINAANVATLVSVGGVQRSIAGWLTWRRDAAPKIKAFQTLLRNAIAGVRREAQAKGMAIVQAVQVTGSNDDKDVVINVDEKALAGEIEAMETTLGTLDGLLSLKNATILIEV